MDIRTPTILFCAVLALAIAATVLLRSRLQRAQWLFAAFAALLSFWYLSEAFFVFFKGNIWDRVTALIAVIMPQLAVRLFGTIVPQSAQLNTKEVVVPNSTGDAIRTRVLHIMPVFALPMVALILSPYHKHDATRISLFVYVLVLTSAALWAMAAQGRASQSRAVRARTAFLVVIGALATAFTLLDFLWWVGNTRLAPIGAVFSILFLYVLSESLRSKRLLDLYDLLGRLLIATALAFCIALIFYLCMAWIGAFKTIYLNAILASIIILVLFNPLQNWVEAKIHQLVFRERFALESVVRDLRRRLAHVLEARDMVTIVLTSLEQSRRVTYAAFYLLDRSFSAPGGVAFVLEEHIGLKPNVVRIEEGSSRALLDRLSARGYVMLEDVEREALETQEIHTASLTHDIYARLQEIGAGLALALNDDEGELIGIFVITDDRVRDAFTPEEISLFEELAGQIVTVLENNRAYDRIKERDRLAALGAMSAGLAHEVKNPLGAIKGAAQLLAESSVFQSHQEEPTLIQDDSISTSDREFLNIILEEVDRLDRIVSSILDYSRVRSGAVEPIDVNAVIQRTMQILAPARNEHIDFNLVLTEQLPLARIDPEQLRQVLINLVNNAIQAMSSRGQLHITTAYRRQMRRFGHNFSEHGVIEIRVKDTGPGISNKVLKNLFVPFFTTKSTGTGLGLAISQRIVQNAGGYIDVQTSQGVGTTFGILLPAVAFEVSPNVN